MKKISWATAVRDIVIWVVLGWIICSVASCTAKSQQAKFHFMETTGVVIW